MRVSCQLLGTLHSKFPAGDQPDLMTCHLFTFCTETPSTLTIKGEPVKCCQGCHRYLPAGAIEERSIRDDCDNLLPVIREDVSNLCGSRGEQIKIYGCKIHGECALFRYCQHQEVKTCLTCHEYFVKPTG